MDKRKSDVLCNIYNAYTEGHISSDEKDSLIQIITETKSEGLRLQNHMKYDKNGESDKNIRKIDVLRQQLKHGKLSQEEFDKKADKIISDENKIADYPGYLTKQGSSVLDQQLGPRPNKEKSSATKDTFFHKDKPRKISANDVDPTTMEKIQRHLAICRSTDNDAEYKTHFNALCKLLGADNKTPLKINAGLFQVDGESYKPTKKVSKLDSMHKFVHTSPKNNLTKLTPTNRSTDGVLYPDKRVYFSTKKPINKNGLSKKFYKGTDNDVHEYEYKGLKRKDAKKDPEMPKTSAAYISTKDALPVKQRT